jgi:hypothetical protein
MDVNGMAGAKSNQWNTVEWRSGWESRNERTPGDWLLKEWSGRETISNPIEAG